MRTIESNPDPNPIDITHNSPNPSVNLNQTIYSNQTSPTIQILAELHAINQNVNNNFLVTPCEHPKCKSCTTITLSNTLYSSVTKKLYKIPYQMNCNSNNIIYLITCVGSRAYKISCHLNSRKVPSVNLSRESTVCLTSPIFIKALNFVKTRYTAANCPQLTHNIAVHDVLLINK